MVILHWDFFGQSALSYRSGRCLADIFQKKNEKTGTADNKPKKERRNGLWPLHTKAPFPWGLY
jgi:hypothetical protein